MAEKKNTTFNRPGGYAQPKGATQTQRKSAKALATAEIKLYGDTLPTHEPNRQIAKSPDRQITPDFSAPNPNTQLYIGDCRDILAALPEKGHVDLIFADPPFNWDVPYGGDDDSDPSTSDAPHEKLNRQPTADSRKPNAGWNDAMSRAAYERFTFDWLDGCIEALAPHGSLWVNIPDDTAAEVVLHLKRRGLTMINWCIWHFRFGQNRNSSFIMSKVHALYFAKEAAIGGSQQEGSRPSALGSRQDPTADSGKPTADSRQPTAPSRIWNPNEILELSDRASIYFDPRTMAKDSNKGLRVPMDVWYGKYWGRIQGNNKERRHNHHNQIPEIYLERVIKACSNPDSLVLDPFCGSGTTSTVARALGRKSITIEYSPVIAKSAWERITKLGMVPREDAGKPQSSAIFGSRLKRRVAGQRT